MTAGTYLGCCQRDKFRRSCNLHTTRIGACCAKHRWAQWGTNAHTCRHASSRVWTYAVCNLPCLRICTRVQACACGHTRARFPGLLSLVARDPQEKPKKRMFASSLLTEDDPMEGLSLATPASLVPQWVGLSPSISLPCKGLSMELFGLSCGGLV